MKKNNIILLGLATLLAIAGLLSGYNKHIDMTYSYEKAVFSLPDGTVVSGKVQSWTDYTDGDKIQVKIDGKRYLVHSEDIVLISE